ncbi:hypothetical protein AMECASPLE_019695 [Ameca splendens]|uniref:Uncharacterized protein n=1 Tax=Ameca splendens TaxID=208324 RepID=A0ABV0Z2Q2_9TELE
MHSSMQEGRLGVSQRYVSVSGSGSSTGALRKAGPPLQCGVQNSRRTSLFYHSIIHIKVDSFSALVRRERRGAHFMSIRPVHWRRKWSIPPAADEQEFTF